MRSCEVVSDYQNEIVNMSRRASQTGNEQAMAICQDGTLKRSSGSGGSVTLDNCEEELVNLHTHPAWSPVEHSRQDIFTLMQMTEGEMVERECVVGVEDPVEVRCLEMDRSDVSTDEYRAIATDIMSWLKEQDQFDDTQRHTDLMSECSMTLE
jgi:hypothetical protein